jgi:hypothetical protein
MPYEARSRVDTCDFWFVSPLAKVKKRAESGSRSAVAALAASWSRLENARPRGASRVDLVEERTRRPIDSKVYAFDSADEQKRVGTSLRSRARSQNGFHILRCYRNVGNRLQLERKLLNSERITMCVEPIQVVQQGHHSGRLKVIEW